MCGIPDREAVRSYLVGLQDWITDELERADGRGRFRCDRWERDGGGGGESRVMEGGALLEKGGVGFSHVRGSRMPVSATQSRPELAGASFEAMGLSLVLHPLNPYVPTTHMNVRLFIADPPGGAPVWWFGGGFDLTPYYAFEEDAVAWHRAARDLCAPFGADVYPRCKDWCDRYFQLPHRGETRGVGGLLFDDLADRAFEHCFAFMRAVGDGFLAAWLPIAERRRHMAWGERERDFQLYRRGRYVEFNLLYDRGTVFGLQSGGRTESILMSLPPVVHWQYDWRPQPGSAEAKLYTDFLRPRDWLGQSRPGVPSTPSA